MAKTTLNIYAKNPTKVINALKTSGPASSKRLAEIIKMPRGSVTSAIKALHAAGMIHIGGWELNKTTMPTRIYTFGPGKDVREPIFLLKRKECNPVHIKLPWPHADIAASWLKNSI
jgi:hypothetical protein